MLLYQILAFTVHRKIEKSHTKSNNKFKISAPTWNEKFDYLSDHILYHIFKIILSTSRKKTWRKD